MSRYDILQGRIPEVPSGTPYTVPASQIILGSTGTDDRFYKSSNSVRTHDSSRVIERFRGREGQEYRCRLTSNLLAVKVHWDEVEKRLTRCKDGASCTLGRNCKWRVLTTLIVYENMDRRPRHKPRIVPWTFGERMLNDIRNLDGIAGSRERRIDELDFKMECTNQDFQIFGNLRLCKTCFCEPWKEELKEESAVLLETMRPVLLPPEEYGHFGE